MRIDLKNLFADHGRDVDAFLRRRLNDPAAAADLTQEAFLRLARLPGDERINDPKRFLFTVAANLARDHIRRLVSQRTVIAESASTDDAICAATLPDSALIAQEDEALMRAAIDALPGRTRTIFLMFHAENRSYRDIGDSLGVSPRTVEYHLRQALTQCRNYVRDAAFRSQK